MSANAKSSRSTKLLAGALLVATVIVAVVSWRYRNLATDVRRLSERVTEPYPGMYVPVLERESLAGTTVRVGAPASGHVQLLLFFNTTCSYCRASLPASKELTRRLADKQLTQMVGVSWDSLPATRSYVSQHGLAFPVVSLPNRRWTHLFRTRSVPYALLVSPQGLILWAREGVWQIATVDSVVSILSETHSDAAASM